jgi:hypothetical protein
MGKTNESEDEINQGAARKALQDTHSPLGRGNSYKNDTRFTLCRSLSTQTEVPSLAQLLFELLIRLLA